MVVLNILSLLEKNIFGKSQSDQLAISLVLSNLGLTTSINIAETIDKEPDQMIWEDFESVLKNLSGEDANLVDKNGYKRGCKLLITFIESRRLIN